MRPWPRPAASPAVPNCKKTLAKPHCRPALEVVEQTQQVDRRRAGLRRATEAGDQTGAGSQRYERRFRFGPDEVKDLETEEAVVRASHPVGVYKLLVYRCEQAEEAAALASVRTREGEALVAAATAVMSVGKGRASCSRARDPD